MTPVSRRTLLRLGTNLGVGLAGGAFVAARTGLTIASAPAFEGTGVPSEPSFIGTLIYGAVIVHQTLFPIRTVADELANLAHPPANVPPLPAGVTLAHVDADGVPAELIRAPGSVSGRALFYIHGGGWAVPLQDGDRVFAAQLAQATGATVLLPAYRLLPEYPFPAGCAPPSVPARGWRSSAARRGQIWCWRRRSRCAMAAMCCQSPS